MGSSIVKSTHYALTMTQCNADCMPNVVLLNYGSEYMRFSNLTSRNIVKCVKFKQFLNVV